MSFPQIRLTPLLCLFLSLSTASLLFGQTPTPTSPPDSDGDGVPDHQDGWPQHKQLTTAPVPESQYVVIALGHGIGYGINNLGDVAGEGVNDNGEREAVLWRAGQPPTFLGFLTQNQTLNRWSIAWGINDAGQITGRSPYCWDPNVSGEYPNPPTYPVWGGYCNTHAFLWQAGTMTDLNDLSLGQPVDPNYPDPTNKGYSEGRAINRDGIVAGQSDTDAATESDGWTWLVVHNGLHAASFNGAAAPIDLGIVRLDGSSDAAAINDHGAIVGGGGDYAQNAFFQLNGQTQIFPPASEATHANGLNNLDHVVGTLGYPTSAFIWVPASTLPENERVVDLGIVSLAGNFRYTGADAINDRDEVVGTGSFGFTGNREALLWQNGEVHPLNDLIGAHPNFTLANAPGINQSGMIVANTADSDEGDVYLLVPDELLVDANNDGKMSFTNAAMHNKDKTKKHAPYTFWVNNDRDEGDTDVPVDGLPDWTKDVIDQARDLEDFTRLWISFKGLTALVKSPGVQLRLEWQPNNEDGTWRPADGNPAIKLFPAAEADGGRKYLERQNWAETQASPPYNATYGLVRRDFPLLLPLAPVLLQNLTEEQPNLYFLFEGVARGKGRLVLKLLQNGQTLAEYPPLYLELKDVKDMYERWTVGDVTEVNTSVFSSLDYQVWPTDAATQVFGPSQTAMPDPTRDAEKDYILMVHGWNASPFSKDYVGDTAFKRLFWQGYTGRFGLFRWPTFYFTGDVPPVHHFDASEHRAWASSLGLLNLITQLNNGPFSGRIRLTAHSMGNVVASEALRRSESGQIVHTYIASQAAIPAHCFDATTSLMTFAPGLGPSTPDVYAYYWQPGATSQPHQWQSENRPSYMQPDYMLGKAERYFNYYNDGDFALRVWQFDQQSKPDNSYKYIDNGSPPTTGFRRKIGSSVTWLTFPGDTYEIFAWGAESRSFALGAQFVRGVVADGEGRNVDLSGPPFNYGRTSKFHSAQFYDTNARRGDYWRSLVTDMLLGIP
jgi:uncharacterized membrane protein